MIKSWYIYSDYIVVVTCTCGREERWWRQPYDSRVLSFVCDTSVALESKFNAKPCNDPFFSQSLIDIFTILEYDQRIYLIPFMRQIVPELEIKI